MINISSKCPYVCGENTGDLVLANLPPCVSMTACFAFIARIKIASRRTAAMSDRSSHICIMPQRRQFLPLFQTFLSCLQVPLPVSWPKTPPFRPTEPCLTSSRVFHTGPLSLPEDLPFLFPSLLHTF